MRIIVSNKFAKLLTRERVSKLSLLMRVSYGLHCMCDEMSVGEYNVNKNCNNINLVHRYDRLQHENCYKYDKALVSVSPICDVAKGNNNVLNIKQQGSRIGTWNFQGLCSHRKALEIGKVLSKIHIDIVGCQES